MHLLILTKPIWKYKCADTLEFHSHWTSACTYTCCSTPCSREAGTNRTMSSWGKHHAHFGRLKHQEHLCELFQWTLKKLCSQRKYEWTWECYWWNKKAVVSTGSIAGTIEQHSQSVMLENVIVFWWILGGGSGIWKITAFWDSTNCCISYSKHCATTGVSTANDIEHWLITLDSISIISWSCSYTCAEACPCKHWTCRWWTCPNTCVNNSIFFC